MRLLWSLPKAAPALLRHLAAYVDLASLDLARVSREFAAEFVACVVIAICALFALLMGCLVVVAFTWDTRYRVAAIAWMAGGFLVGAIAAALALLPLGHFTPMTMPPVASRSFRGSTGNTAFGVPAAAHTVPYCNRSASRYGTSGIV